MTTTNQRLLALDILRGLTIIFMIIVNDPGSWSHVYAPLLHADWNGLTPTDYIFPTFLFIMGTSIVLSLSKRSAQSSKTDLLKKVVWRAVKIYLVGLFLWLWPDFDFGEIRWTGVLQRISVVYLLCALCYLYLSKKQQIILAIGVLTAYLVVMCFVPVPGIGMPDLSVPEKNWAHYIDNLYLPGYLWEETWDPEGILSTFPAMVTGLFGMFAAYLLQRTSDVVKQMNSLFIFATVLLVLGDLTKYIFPLNKALWSTSFTLVLGGISSIALASCIYLCDYKNYGHRFKMAHAFGVNSIFAYTLAGMCTLIFYSSSLWGISLSATFVEFALSNGLSAKLFSFLYALFYVVVIWIPVNILSKRKIYIKL